MLIDSVPALVTAGLSLGVGMRLVGVLFASLHWNITSIGRELLK